jgi:hypothetical protein
MGVPSQGVLIPLVVPVLPGAPVHPRAPDPHQYAPALLGAPVRLIVLELSHYQFAVVVVVLEDTLSGLLFRSAASDSVASDIGKSHFLAWAEPSQHAELVRDGCPQPFDHPGYCAESTCCSPGWYAEPYRSYCRRCDR